MWNLFLLFLGDNIREYIIILFFFLVIYGFISIILGRCLDILYFFKLSKDYKIKYLSFRNVVVNGRLLDVLGYFEKSCFLVIIFLRLTLY